jgi:hypothetical protein
MFLNNTFDSIQFDLNSLCIKNVNYSSTTRVPTPYSSGSSSDLYHSHSSGSSKVGTTPNRVGSGQKKGECNTLVIIGILKNEKRKFSSAKIIDLNIKFEIYVKK